MTSIAPARPARVAVVVLLTVGVLLGLLTTAPNPARAAGGSKPIVTKLAPAAGPVTGGAKVTITGKRLGRTTKVTFAGVKARILKIKKNELTVVVPAARAGRAGKVPVRIKTRTGTSVRTKRSIYTYAAAPVLRTISPATGPSAGGTLVTITGAGLASTSRVRFGTASATNLRVVNASTITVRAPGSLAAAVPVRVTTAGGTTTASTRYTYTRTGLVTTPAVGGGWDHSVALKADGTVWAWGRNLAAPLGGVSQLGVLGTGSTASALTAPQRVVGLSQVVAVAAGAQHSVALRSDGTVRAWGTNFYGQLGDGTTGGRNAPVRVRGLSEIVAIAAGRSFTVAVRADGAVYAWGNNDTSQLGYQYLGPKPFYRSPVPVRVPGIAHAVDVAAGATHTLAITTDRTIWAWGSNDRGQLADGTLAYRPAPARVGNRSGPLRDVVAVAAGEATSYALRADGSLLAWGDNRFGQAGQRKAPHKTTSPVPVWTLESGVTAIAAGRNHAAAVKDGKVYAWGFNLRSATIGPGAPTTPAGVVLEPHLVAGLNGVRSLGAGDGFSVALTDTGSLWSWGANDQGQLGNGGIAHSATPGPVTGVTLG